MPVAILGVADVGDDIECLARLEADNGTDRVGPLPPQILFRIDDVGVLPAKVEIAPVDFGEQLVPDQGPADMPVNSRNPSSPTVALMRPRRSLSGLRVT